MSSSTGPINSCVAQMLLRKENKSECTPSYLAEKLDIHHTAAGIILNDLCWRRERSNDGYTTYHYEGRDKVFSGAVVAVARRRLMAILGISREEVLEVLT